MPTSRRTHAELPPGLKISMHDRVAGTIVALLVIVGFAVTVLVLLWLAGRAMAGNEIPPLELLEENPAGGFQARGSEREMVEPGIEEFADMPNPQLADSLAAVTTSVTTQQAALDELFGNADALGTGQGQGNRNPIGSGGDGDQNIVPRWERFQLRLQSTSLRAYAKQLDFFRIELGVMGGGINGITYASRFNAEAPLTRSGFGDGEKRLYFSQDSELKELDAQLLADAGVVSHGREVVYFVPADVENKLAHLERDHAKGRPLEEIQRTVFGVQSAGQGYAFYVVGQEYRP